MTVSELRKSIINELTGSVGDREARAMASVILEQKYGLTPVDIAVSPNRSVEPTTVETVKRIVDRVNGGEPLQYILGTAPFHGLEFVVRPGVLIPRPETSELVDIVVDRCGHRSDLRILDVCSGSGCIGIALGRALKFPAITAVDIDDTAIETTRLNASRLKVNVDIEKRDIIRDGLPSGEFDIIISNPPYIDESEKTTIDPRVRDHEPSLALFVPDDDPLIFYREIGRSALSALAPDGLLFFEINPRHVVELKTMLSDMGFSEVEAGRDFNGLYRYITVRR